MLKSTTQINELLLTSHRGKTTCKTFIANASPELQKKMGQLFAIIEIDSEERENEKIIKTIFSELNNYFYGPKNSRKEQPTEETTYSQLPLTGIENAEVVFEESLQKLNQRLTELIREEKLNLLPEKLNIIIGIIKDKTLIFTQVGDLNAFLVHKKKNDDYSMVNLIERESRERDKLNLIRIFSHISSGTIGPEDIMIFSTPSLFDYFSLEKLKITLITLTLPSAIHQLKTILTDADPNLNFAAIIIKLVTQRERKISLAEEKMIPSSQASMAELSMTHARTKEFLTPSLLVTVKKYAVKNCQLIFVKIKFFTASSQKWLQQKKEKRGKQIKARQKIKEKEILLRERQKQRRQTTRRISAPEKTSAPLPSLLLQYGSEAKKRLSYKSNEQSQAAAKKIKRFLSDINFYGKKMFLAIRKSFLSLEQNLQKKKTVLKNSWNPIVESQRLKTKTKELAETISKIIKLLFIKHKKLPAQSRRLLLIGLALALLFLISLINLNLKQKKEAALAAFNRQTDEIEKRINSAEASIIYNDENKGRKLLQEASAQLAALAADSKEQKNSVDNLQKEINELLLKIQHIKNIEGPELLADLSNLDPTVRLGAMLFSKGAVYTFNPDNNVIYRVATGGQKKTETMESDAAFGHLRLAVNKNSNTIIFLRDNNGLAEFDVNQHTLQGKNIVIAGNNPQIKDLAIFNRRLYMLDSGNAQIYKYEEALSGYARGTPWLKDSQLDLGQAVSLAVDGFIYTLKGNGEITRLSGGIKQNLKFSAPDPAWGSPSKIYTEPESDYIYVLDPLENRLVVFDKKGRLDVQYRSDNFNDLKDFAVNEQDEQIYLLAGSKIYKIEATHL